jgi:GGDEF domain-containing protein
VNLKDSYRWALIQAVLLALNKEIIDAYLKRTFYIIQRQQKWVNIKHFTVLYLCSAHIIKGVNCSIGRKTNDKSLREFSTFIFERLQNTIDLKTACRIFRHFCIALLTEHLNDDVQSSLDFLKALIYNSKSQEQEDHMEAELYSWEDAEIGRSVKTLVGSSPYTREFKGIYEEVSISGRRTAGKCSQVKSIPLPHHNKGSSGQLHLHTSTTPLSTRGELSQILIYLYLYLYFDNKDNPFIHSFICS